MNSDRANQIYIALALGRDPKLADEEEKAFAVKVKQEIEQIVAAGGELHIPTEYPNPDAPGGNPKPKPQTAA